jgi:hypothetical protein
MSKSQGRLFQATRRRSCSRRSYPFLKLWLVFGGSVLGMKRSRFMVRVGALPITLR